MKLLNNPLAPLPLLRLRFKVCLIRKVFYAWSSGGVIKCFSQHLIASNVCMQAHTYFVNRIIYNERRRSGRK